MWAINEAHSVAYAKKVHELLSKAKDKAGAEDVLDAIGKTLLDPTQGAKNL